MATYTKDKDVETNLEDDAEARKAMQEVFPTLPDGQLGLAASPQM